jgi:hypothetical protein
MVMMLMIGRRAFGVLGVRGLLLLVRMLTWALGRGRAVVAGVRFVGRAEGGVHAALRGVTGDFVHLSHRVGQHQADQQGQEQERFSDNSH